MKVLTIRDNVKLAGIDIVCDNTIIGNVTHKIVNGEIIIDKYGSLTLINYKDISCTAGLHNKLLKEAQKQYKREAIYE